MNRIKILILTILTLLFSNCAPNNKTIEQNTIGEISFDLPKGWKTNEQTDGMSLNLKPETASKIPPEEGISITIQDRKMGTNNSIQKKISFDTINKVAQVRNKVPENLKPELTVDNIQIITSEIDGFKANKVVHPIYRKVDEKWVKYLEKNYILFTEKSFYIISINLPKHQSDTEQIEKQFIESIKVNEKL